jgi:ligand-binding SRPBCC domain-containing protein
MRLLASLMTAPADPSTPLEHLHRETVVPAALDETFAFFADAANLQWLTPPWLAFRIVTPLPMTMRAGHQIDYRVAVWGVPLPWRSVIDLWEPGVCFVDRQVIGPYRWWRHEHRFEATAAGTRVVDHVEYVPRLRRLTSRIVMRDLERIFDYRQAALQRHFASPAGRRRRA